MNHVRIMTGVGAALMAWQTLATPVAAEPISFREYQSAKDVENLLLAGRCLSGEPAAAGAVRVMPPCMAMGQAAGTAAALALREGTTPRVLDASKLIATLRAQKAFLG